MRIREGSVITRRSSGSLSVGRADGDAGEIGIRGIGAPYGVWSTIWDTPYSLVRERYAPGCFKASLASDVDVMCCRDHKRDDILGRLSNDTLELSEDSEGLQFNVRLNPDDPQAVRIFAQVKRQDIKGASTRFKVDELESKEKKENNRYVYEDTIVKATLFEVGPVTDPAYPTTTADVRERSGDEFLDALAACRVARIFTGKWPD